MVISHVVIEVDPAVYYMKGNAITIYPAQGKHTIELNSSPVGGSFGDWHAC
ncbi:unnamed protein product [marine sediment metagenome]|uniref:Uncharacterized protein n=1 Tax=marine sediment metagenome TaxID=412755 RepID=X1VYK2_9ZZZZ